MKFIHGTNWYYRQWRIARLWGLRRGFIVDLGAVWFALYW